ncbi:hypothetical protein D3C72_532190 [compost metagenome]
MLQGERPEQQRFRHHPDIQRFRWITGAFVMIAANQCHRQISVARAPLCQRVQRTWRMRAGPVEEVTEKDQ